MDLPDSDYYLYSLGGFAPCFFYDFTSNYTFEITLNCKIYTDLLNLQTGYQYRDVVEPAKAASTKFALGASWSSYLDVHFNIRDMKYLSNANRSVWTTTDADVMAGLKPMEITLNFNDLLT